MRGADEIISAISWKNTIPFQRIFIHVSSSKFRTARMSSPVTEQAEIFTDTSPDEGALAAAAGADLINHIEMKQGFAENIDEHCEGF